MTKKEIEKLGFTPNSGANMWNFPGIKYSIYISSSFTIKNIIESVYKLGIDAGVDVGKEILQEEIKHILNITS